ncbi:hypothetical protein ACWGRL_04820 [[Kitasatospora] papulosa]
MTAQATAPALPTWARRAITGRLKLVLAKVQRCKDCRVDVRMISEWYTVHDHVWAQAGTCQQGYLCIGCLETRIGRPLTSHDFTDAPVNRHNSGKWGRRSTRFTDRLARTPTENLPMPATSPPD